VADVGSALISSLAFFSGDFDGDVVWNPFTCLNFYYELLASDPGAYITFLRECASAEQQGSDSGSENEELHSILPKKSPGAEVKIYQYVLGVVEYDELVLQERAKHFPMLEN